MIRFWDRVKSIIYRMLRPKIPNKFNCCNVCKKYRRNWVEFDFADSTKDYLIGYDKILAEYVAFTEYNLYAKILVMNKYVVDIHKLNQELFDAIRLMCRKCIRNYLKNYVEVEDA